MSNDPQFPVPPVPVMPVEYPSANYNSGRPGIVTAVGVMSVVLSVFSLLVSGVCTLWGIVLVTMSAAARWVPANQTVTTTVTSTATTSTPPIVSETLGPRGLPTSDRKIIVTGLQKVHPISEARQKQVDEMLASNGADLFSTGGPGISVAVVAANISESGQLPTASGINNGSDFFVLGNGRLEVADDHAAFFPNDGQPPIRTAATTITADATAVTPGSLTAVQVQNVLRRVKNLDPQLTAAQSAAIANTLKNPGEQFIVPTTDGTDPAQQIFSVSAFGTGSVSISTRYNNQFNSMSIAPAGNILSSTSNNFANGGQFPFKIGKASAAMALAGSVVGFGLAVLLLIAGILVLRGNRVGPRLHWIFAIVKLPVEVIAAVGFGLSLNGMMGGVPTATAHSRDVAGWVLFGAMLFAGCVYPIMLLFMLRVRALREYFHGVTAGY